jgi:hypothetical protein
MKRAAEKGDVWDSEVAGIGTKVRRMPGLAPPRASCRSATFLCRCPSSPCTPTPHPPAPPPPPPHAAGRGRGCCRGRGRHPAAPGVACDRQHCLLLPYPRDHGGVCGRVRPVSCCRGWPAPGPAGRGLCRQERAGEAQLIMGGQGRAAAVQGRLEEGLLGKTRRALAARTTSVRRRVSGHRGHSRTDYVLCAACWQEARGDAPSRLGC